MFYLETERFQLKKAQVTGTCHYAFSAGASMRTELELSSRSLLPARTQEPQPGPPGGHVGSPLGSQHWAGNSGTRTVTAWD